MAFKKLTPEEKASREAAKLAAKTAKTSAPKVRKVRTPGPKAPNKADKPAMWAAYEIGRALKIVEKIDNATAQWGSGAGAYFTNALASMDSVTARFAAMPADFKPSRSRKGGKTVFTIGQRVVLSADAMARVNQLFPDVADDCVFKIATNAKPADKLLPIVCLGRDGELAPFFVDRAPRKDLTPFEFASTIAA